MRLAQSAKATKRDDQDTSTGAMKINTGWDRWMHLAILIFFTAVGGWLLIHFCDWAPLAAVGLSCTVTCQVNNVVQQLRQPDSELSKTLQNYGLGPNGSASDTASTDTPAKDRSAATNGKKKGSKKQR